MSRKRIPITREMIQRHFGASARITSFLGRYTVRTARGGEVKITDRYIDPICGGADVYRAAVLLADEAWGGGTVHGPADFKIAALAWGESEHVVMRVAERGGFARIVVAALAALIVLIGFDVVGSSYGPIISGVIALLVWLLMKRAAKREAQHETDQMRFPYPRTGGDAREADDEDLKKGGWL
jgi:hypothetical protein